MKNQKIQSPVSATLKFNELSQSGRVETRAVGTVRRIIADGIRTAPPKDETFDLSHVSTIPLSDRAAQVLEIYRHAETLGLLCPSTREVAELAGFPSQNSTMLALKELQAKRYVIRNVGNSAARAVQCLGMDLPSEDEEVKKAKALLKRHGYSVTKAKKSAKR
jgi:hypothetical protein